MKPMNNIVHDASPSGIHGVMSKSSEGTGPLGSEGPKDKSIPPAHAAFNLFLCCIIMLGLYYLIAMPASVRQHLKEVMPTDDNTFEKRFSLLFTMAFLPNTILPFFTGRFIDRIGPRTCLLVLSITCFLGQVLASAGVQNYSWRTLIAGRLIYGLGFESLFVSNEAFLSIIFDGGGRGLALGCSSAASYVGYLLSPIISPVAANRLDVAFAFWVGAIMMGAPVLAAICIRFLLAPSKAVGRIANTNQSSGSNNVHEKESHAVSVEVPPGNPSDDENEAPPTDEIVKMVRLSDIRKLPLTYWLLCLSCMLTYATNTGFVSVASGELLEKYLMRETSSTHSGCSLVLPNQCSSGYLAPHLGGNPLTVTEPNGQPCTVGDDEVPIIPSSLKITLSDHATWDKDSYIFPRGLARSDIDCSDDFWSEACTKDYCDKQAEATQLAGIYISLPFIITATTTFLFGHWGVDRWGLQAEMLAVAPLLSTSAHALLAFCPPTVLPASVPLILMGFGFSIYVSALWPSVPLVVPKGVTGTAFGLMTCVQAVGNAFFPLMASAIYYHGEKQRYIPEVEIFLMGCSAFVAALGAMLLLSNRMPMVIA